MYYVNMKNFLRLLFRGVESEGLSHKDDHTGPWHLKTEMILMRFYRPLVDKIEIACCILQLARP